MLDRLTFGLAARAHALADHLAEGSNEWCEACYASIEGGILDDMRDTFGERADSDPYLDLRLAAIGLSRSDLSGTRLA